jgi:nucleoside-diphosphate-sugar epimerase
MPAASQTMTDPQTEPWPALINTEAELDDLLTRPSSALVAFIKTVSSPLMILGAGGKMGPTLAVLARRAAALAGHPLEVVAASRFQDGAARSWLERQGVRTIACDLLDAASVAALPEARHVIYLVGLKFGTAQNPAMTWAMNTLVPARVSERYAQAHLVALSTGNVYPLTEVSRGGSVETDALTPLGEYANAAVARERLFQFYSQRHKTPVALLRLYYAVELRYGVLVDIARFVLSGQAIPLANGSINCIWQGDANEMILRALAHASAPPCVLNLCRPEILSVRDVAMEFGRQLECAPRFAGQETATALLGNTTRMVEALGSPTVPVATMVRWIAHWVKRGGRNLDKPTHFETRDGHY